MHCQESFGLKQEPINPPLHFDCHHSLLRHCCHLPDAGDRPGHSEVCIRVRVCVSVCVCVYIFIEPVRVHSIECVCINVLTECVCSQSECLSVYL